MGLGDMEGEKFWPLSDAYQKKLEQINQRLGLAAPISSMRGSARSRRKEQFRFAL